MRRTGRGAVLPYPPEDTMDFSLYLSFIAYACATTFLPGPNNVLLFSRAGRYGFRRIRMLLFGIWTGLVVVMMLAGLFCNVLGTFIPKIAGWFKYVGAAYILYLAWKTLRKGKVQEPSSTPGGEQTGNAAAPDEPEGFVNGFLLQFLNVKVIMLGLAAYPGYFLPMGNSFGIVLLFAVTMTVCCGTGNLIWTFLGNILTPVYNRYYRVINAVMALLLVWCAVKVIS